MELGPIVKEVASRLFTTERTIEREKVYEALQKDLGQVWATVITSTSNLYLRSGSKVDRAVAKLTRLNFSFARFMRKDRPNTKELKVRLDNFYADILEAQEELAKAQELDERRRRRTRDEGTLRIE